MNSVKGFTIIELVISIFVLSIAVVGIFNALSIIIILTSDSTDRLMATYLAQEGMEIVRNIRDTNWLNMDNATAGNPGPGGLHYAYSWIDGLTGDSAVNSRDCSNQPCQADYKSTFMVPATGDHLCIDPTNGFYYQPTSDCGAAKSKFERKIIITSIPDNNESDQPPYHIIKVKVEVSWDKKATILGHSVLADVCGPNNCITTEETLYNWYNVSISVVGVTINDPYNQNPDNPNESANTILDVNGNGAYATDPLTAVINPSYATNQNVTWFSGACSVTTSQPCGSDSDCPSGERCNSSSEFITVDKNGVVTAMGPGTNIPVTVTTSDGQKTYTDYFDITNNPR